MARKRKRRGAKRSRKHAMPKTKRGRRRKGGRRRRNPNLPVWGKVVLGAAGYGVAGGLSYLVQSKLMPTMKLSNANILVSTAGTIATMAASSAVGGDITGPLAAGMAANVMMNILGMAADSAKLDEGKKKFLGLSNQAASSAGATAASQAASSAGATAASLPAASTSASSGTLAVTHTPGGFLDASGTNLAAMPIGSKKVTDSDGNVTDVEVWGVVKDGKTLTLTDEHGGVWVRHKVTGEFLAAPASSLSGTFPPWAGFPGYDQRGFPQQVVSLPAKLAPHVQGYANYAPAMSGYANYAPSMGGWDPGYGHM